MVRAEDVVSPGMQVLAHAGYDLPPEHVRDMELLRERLGVEYP